MRIVLVLEDLNDTGANRVSLDRAAHWQRSGETVTLFVTTSPDGAGQLAPPAGSAVVRASPTGSRLRSALPRASWTLLRLARNADVLVVGTEVGFGLLLARAAAFLVRRPLAVTVQSRVDHAIDNYVMAPLRGLTRAALGRVDLAVCVSHGLLDSTTRLGVPRRRVTAAPNAVPVRQLSERAREPAAVRWDESVPLVVGVGRLVRQKGFDLLIRAHARALEEGAPAHQLMIVGEGEDRDDLQVLAHELGVHRTVLLPGFVGNPHAIMARASLFVLSSRWEGFSLVLAEALGHGTASVAFDCVAGPSEVLARGRYGRLVPPEDVHALARAIAGHLADPGELTSRAQLAVEHEPDLFDPARAASLHLHALYDLTGRGSVVDSRTPA